MYRPDKWIDDDDAFAQKFVRTTSVVAVRPTPSQCDCMWDANDVAGYLKVGRSWVYHRAGAPPAADRYRGSVTGNGRTERHRPKANRALSTRPDVVRGK
jgi:hypothetical protein